MATYNESNPKEMDNREEEGIAKIANLNLKASFLDNYQGNEE